MYRCRVMASTDKPEVKIGLQSQVASDVTITEAGAGVILALPRGFAGNLEIVCPAGVSFSALPAVSVTAGNLILNTANIALNAPWNNVLTIPVQASGTTASTIKLSNVKLTIDRTVPEGEVKLSVGGSAVDMVNKKEPGIFLGPGKGKMTPFLKKTGNCFEKNLFVVK